MIAKIGKGENLYGAICYNQLKVDQENGKILLLNKIPEKLNGLYSAAYLHEGFIPYLSANNKTEKPVRHISLNPDPKDIVSDEQFCEMAQQYMQEMGYGNQPFVVFKHTDISRTHIHIVTTCVGRDGKKIPDTYDHPRSMAICRDLEKKYCLTAAIKNGEQQKSNIFHPVDYKAGNIKSQIASVVRHLPKYYNFQNMGTYNALLSLFNITVEEVKGELQGLPKQGLVYFALDEKGNKASNPFKASRFGDYAVLEQLQKHFDHSKEQMKNAPSKAILKNTVEAALQMSLNEPDLKKQLLEQGINVVVRRNAEGRIYGITFIDHESRSVWNGSGLAKNLSANVFNEHWNAVTEPLQSEHNTPDSQYTEKSIPHFEQPHPLFDFINEGADFNSINENGIIDALVGILPEAPGEDYEELDFANRMKKKRRRPKR